MTPERPRDITIMMGVHSAAARAVQDTARKAQPELGAAGLSILRQWRAPRILVPALETPTPEARADLIARLHDGLRLFLCHINGLGPMSDAIGEGVLYPRAEAAAASLGRLFPADRLKLVLCLPRLSRFFVTLGGAAGRVVRQARWEELYELNWADRIEMIREVLPEAEILILTDEGVARQPARAALEVFRLPGLDNSAFLAAGLDEEGQAKLADDAPRRGLLDAHPWQPDPDVLVRRGIDDSLSRLLDDRFEEDLQRLAGMARLQVI